MRQWLADVIDQIESVDGLGAVVLMRAGKLFVGEVDITEFDAPPRPPHLPDSLARIESSPPHVDCRAAWSGVLSEKLGLPRGGVGP